MPSPKTQGADFSVATTSINSSNIANIANLKSEYEVNYLQIFEYARNAAIEMLPKLDDMKKIDTKVDGETMYENCVSTAENFGMQIVNMIYALEQKLSEGIKKQIAAAAATAGAAGGGA